MRFGERLQLVLLLLLLAGTVAAAAVAMGSASTLAAKLLGTAGIVAGLAAAAQGGTSGRAAALIEHYSDAERFPYGPPSHVTRRIIDNPDTPAKTWLRNTLFFDRRLGIALAALAIALELGAIWTSG